VEENFLRDEAANDHVLVCSGSSPAVAVAATGRDIGPSVHERRACLDHTSVRPLQAT
jgi:hypothetical protein